GPAGIIASEGLTIGGYLMTQADADFFNMSKKARSPFWYFVYGEMGFDAGAILVLLTALLFHALGLSLPLAMAITALPGLAGTALLILRSKVGKQFAGKHL
ncbi:MAG TPA: hypothetical protein VHB73_01890, partial [Alphaproteobacteria bacterium]|nr:hypothetical protein [Alphaproteobacteria bacterium]